MQFKLRYLIDELDATDRYTGMPLAESIGRDIERLTGEKLGKLRTSRD